MTQKLLAPPSGRHTSLHRARRLPSFGQPRRSGRRWPKRLAIGACSLLLVLVLLVVGLFVYARYTYDKLHKAKVAGLISPLPGQPFDVLLVGSDTRAFVDNAAQAAAYGSKQTQTGQRSDVIIIARIVPATRQVRLLSIPRDTWVDIPGAVPNVSGPNRINVAYNNGPSLLVKTIWQTFHIPVSYYASLDFPAFQGMVNALGGIYLDFPYPARDPYSGLDITKTGCQLVNGTQALGLVRSRHYYYYANGAWQYDGLSDLSRIQRQDAFFRAVLARVKTSISLTSIGTVNGFINAASTGLTIDQTLSEGEILSIARMLRGVGTSALATQTLPTSPTYMNGAAVLVPVVGADQQVISQFLSFGASPAPAGGATATTAAALGPLPAGATPATLARLDSATSPSPTIPPVNTVPGTPNITNPGSIDYNTQPEPWNPTVCTP